MKTYIAIKQIKMNKGTQYWLRWVGVLPLAIIAGLLVTFPLHWVLYMTLSGGADPLVTPYPELPERILSPFASALTMVWVGSRVVPEYKLKTALMLAFAWIFFAGAVFAMGYFGVKTGNIGFTLTPAGLPIFMGVIGAIVGLYMVWKKLEMGSG